MKTKIMNALTLTKWFAKGVLAAFIVIAISEIGALYQPAYVCVFALGLVYTVIFLVSAHKEQTVVFMPAALFALFISTVHMLSACIR